MSIRFNKLFIRYPPYLKNTEVIPIDLMSIIVFLKHSTFFITNNQDRDFSYIKDLVDYSVTSCRY